MREIKFRAWDSDSEYMLYSDTPEEDCFFWIDEKGVRAGFVRTEQPDHLEPPEPTTIEIDEIMQFTGFHDSTGKEIYEGDILDCGQDPNAEVWWDEELGQFSISTYHATLSLCDNLRNAKIKGNKYENPELL